MQVENTLGLKTLNTSFGAHFSIAKVKLKYPKYVKCCLVLK